MKLPYLLLLFITACTQQPNPPTKEANQPKTREVIVPEFQPLLDEAEVDGTILIYVLEDDQYYSNDFQWAQKGFLPASTFKIANSIIALETGVMENDSTLIRWKGEARAQKVWEQDLILRKAFHYSCVPCYQEIARKVGVERMRGYLEELDYGTMVFDSTNLDLFWLQGYSRITPMEQIDFLMRLHQSKLPIAERTEKIMKRMMLLQDQPNYQLRGKTGWSIDQGKNNAWFVGYVVTTDKTYFFATNIEPKTPIDRKKFPAVRKEVTFQALDRMRVHP